MKFDGEVANHLSTESCILHDCFHSPSLLVCPDASRHRLTFRSLLAVSHVSFPILASHSSLGSVDSVLS